LKLNTVLETDKGAVEFTANLTPEEVQFLLEYSINMLMANGALPFTLVDEAQVQIPTGETH
jgi:hypothetical protein